MNTTIGKRVRVMVRRGGGGGAMKGTGIRLCTGWKKV